MFLAFLNHHRWPRRVALLVGGVLLLWALAWWLVPPLLLTQGEKIASEKLGRQVTIGKVDFLPWTLELSVHDLAIGSVGGGAPQVHIERVYLNAAMQSLVHWAPVLDALEIDRPTLRLTQRGPGRYDFDDVLERLRPTGGPQGGPLEFALYNIAVRQGAVDFRDETLGRSHTLRDLQLKVPFLSNLPSQREVKVAPHLAFQLNGSDLEVMAQATPFTKNPQAEASIHLAALDLAPYLGYLPSTLPVRLASGVLDADLRVAFEQAPTPAVKVSGRVQAQHIKVVDASQGALLSLDGLRVQVDEFQPLARLARIEAIELDAPRLAAHRNRSGWLNWALASPATPPGSSARTERTAQGAAPVAGGSAAATAQAPAQAGEWQLAVDRVAVRGGEVEWLDESLPHSARVGVRRVVLDASAIAWPFTHPLQFAGSAEVVGESSSRTPAQVHFQGEATDRKAQVASSVHGVQLGWLAPYLGQFVTPGLMGTLQADFGVAWNAPAVVAHVARLTVDGLELVCNAGQDCIPAPAAGVPMRSKASLVELKKFQIDDAQINLAQRSATVGRVALTQPRALVERAADGRWMFERWQAQAASSGPAPHQALAPPDQPEKPWSLQLAELSLDGGSVAFRDATPLVPVAFLVSALQVRLQDFAPLAQTAKPSPLAISARMGAGRADPGRVEYHGTLGLAPLAVQGTVLATQLPLHALEPYFADALNVRLRRADGSFKGQVQYAQAPAGPQLRVSGDAALEEVRVRPVLAQGAGSIGAAAAQQGGADGDLLNWKALHLRGVQVALAPGEPMAVEVAETTLSDFFARVILQKSGRINLQEWVKTSAPDPRPAGGAVATTASTPQAPTAASALAPVVRIGPVALTGGRVHFSDYFIQPNYSTNLSALTGRLSAFSSLVPAGSSAPAMADLELRGRAEGTAALEIVGKLNPLANPLALDIQAHMRDLELPPLSPYTIKYAGHGVERGKLSMDLAYEVLPNGQLTASNKLVLNQLVFGEPVEGAPASLPVRLAVALLADRNGVIDVDLPISGSLSDPEFRLGPVILKVVGNLVMKAISAPFSLLASAWGGGETMDSVAFAPGSAVLDDRARQQLDAVARALLERPALKMTVAGQASGEAERSAWQRERLQDMLLAQKRRAALRAGQPADAVTALGADEYPALLKELYRRSDIAKPRNLVGMAKDLPQGEVESLLLASIAVPDNAMQELALARGVAVRDYLAQRQLPLERLFLGGAKTVPPASQWTPHAELTLATR